MKLAAQLYTIRDFMKTDEDFAASMKKIADIGYHYVQISGTGPLNWNLAREALDRNGLSCLITHVPLDDILRHPETVIEQHRILDCPIVGIGSGGAFMAEETLRMEAFEQHVKDLRRAGTRLRDAGLKFAYHNHQFEFRRLPDGTRVMEYLLREVPEELMGLTLDVYWLQYAGMPIPDSLRRYGDRTLCLHLKDYRVNDKLQPEFAEVGQGNIPWEPILDIAEEKGIECLAVEQDTCPGDPFESLKMSYDYLQPLMR